MAWQAGRFDTEEFAGSIDAAVVQHWCDVGDPLERLLSLLAHGFAAVCRSNGAEVTPEMFLPWLAPPPAPEQTMEEQLDAAQNFFSRFQRA